MDRHTLEVIKRLEAVATKLETASEGRRRGGRKRQPTSTKLARAYKKIMTLQQENKQLHALLGKEVSI